MRREPLLAALLCVVGALLVLVGAGRAWVLVSVGESALLPTTDLQVTGRDLRPGLTALGLVGLAGVPALAATRGRGRTAVGVLLALTGLGVVALVVQLLAGDPGLVTTALTSEPVRQAGGRDGLAGHATAWFAVTAGGGIALAGAGSLIAVRGRRWQALGRRYDAPTAPAPAPADAARDEAVAERALWEALDRGEDPTGPVDEPSAPPDPPAKGPQPRD